MRCINTALLLLSLSFVVSIPIQLFEEDKSTIGEQVASIAQASEEYLVFPKIENPVEEVVLGVKKPEELGESFSGPPKNSGRKLFSFEDEDEFGDFLENEFASRENEYLRPGSSPAPIPVNSPAGKQMAALQNKATKTPTPAKTEWNAPAIVTGTAGPGKVQMRVKGGIRPVTAWVPAPKTLVEEDEDEILEVSSNSRRLLKSKSSPAPKAAPAPKPAPVHAPKAAPAPVHAPKAAPAPAPKPAPVHAPAPKAVPAPKPVPVHAPAPKAVPAPKPVPVPAPAPKAVSAPKPVPVPAPKSVPAIKLVEPVKSGVGKNSASSKSKSSGKSKKSKSSGKKVDNNSNLLKQIVKEAAQIKKLEKELDKKIDNKSNSKKSSKSAKSSKSVKSSKSGKSSKSKKSENKLSNTQTHCIDHFLALKYDGIGNVYIAGAEPNGIVHTRRGDCQGFSQGWKKVVSFNTKNVDEATIKSSGYAHGITCGGDVKVKAGQTFEKVFSDCAWSMSGAQFPTITTSVSLKEKQKESVITKVLNTAASIAKNNMEKSINDKKDIKETPKVITAPKVIAVNKDAVFPVRMTADNKFELFINGNFIGKGNHWTTTYVFNPKLSNVKNIAISAVNEGGPAAFIGLFGGKITKPSEWKCKDFPANSAPANWNKPDFDDSKWPTALSYGKNKENNVWMSVGGKARPKIPANAEWLWTNDNLRHNEVFCRMNLNLVPETIEIPVDSAEYQEIYSTVDSNSPVTSTIDSEPASSNPVDSNPVVSNPVVSNPVDSNPVVSNPVDSNPVVSNPVVSNPIVSNPVVSNPIFSNPVDSNPVVSNPVVSNPVDSNTVSSNPVVANPVVANPVVANPVVSNPVVSNPVVSNPVDSNPVVFNPVVSNPVVSNPVVSNPVVANPVVANPVVANPVVANPVVAKSVENNRVEVNKIADSVLEELSSGKKLSTGKLEIINEKIDKILDEAKNKEVLELRQILNSIDSSTYEVDEVYKKYLATVDSVKLIKDKIEQLNATIRKHYEQMKVDSENLRIFQLIKPAYFKTLEEYNRQMMIVNLTITSNIVDKNIRNLFMNAINIANEHTQNSTGILSKAFLEHYERYKSLLKKDELVYDEDLKELKSITKVYDVEVDHEQKFNREYRMALEMLNRLKSTYATSKAESEYFDGIVKIVKKLFRNKNQMKSFIKGSADGKCATTIMKTHLANNMI